MKIEEKHRLYWDGHGNKIIRYYFYINRGLTLLNEARYLIMAILAVYAILKIENWMLMPLMFFGSLPILGVLGWISVHKMSKVMDWLNVHFGTHFSKYSVELQEQTLEAITKLNERLENGTNKSSL